MKKKPVKTIAHVVKPHKSNRGFASLSTERRSEIARLGGLAVSRDPEHMRNIGRIGGRARRKKGDNASA